jgi:23S rRNA pseudouridine2604 synthase
MRAKLIAKHPRPTAPNRAPVRAGSPAARKPARPGGIAKQAAPTAETPHRSSDTSRSGAETAGLNRRPGSAPAGQAQAPQAAKRTAAGAKAGPKAGSRADAARNEDGGRNTSRPVNRSGDAPGRRPTSDASQRRPERGESERQRNAPPSSPSRAPRPTGAARPTHAADTRPKRPSGAEIARPASESRARRGDPALQRNTPPSSPSRAPRPTDAARPTRAADTRPKRPSGTEMARPAPRPAPRKSAQSIDSASTSSGSASAADTAGTMRLSKRMSELGLCSRREADEWIENGWVRVDGVLVDALGSRIRPEQKIEISADARAMQARQVTILLHKPVGYVSGQAEDGYAPAVTLVTAANRWDDDRASLRFAASHLRALAPAGRLDIDSTGLLVLTQDGRIAKLLIGENSGVEKEYLVRVTYGESTTDVATHFPADKLALLRHGLSLDDAQLKPAKVSWQNGEQLRFVLREGKKRQIRRMCELVGLQVVGLKRVRMGRVALGALPPGKWRYLLPDEVF